MNDKTVLKYGDCVDYVNRRLSKPIALLFSRYRISPNSVTAFRSLLVMVAMYLFFKAELFTIFCAGLLIEFADILDYVDGDLARLMKRTSKLGEWMEYIENTFQGTLGSLLGFFIVWGIFRKTGDVNIWIVLFFLCFGVLMKKTLILMPVKVDSWVFNLFNPASLNKFNEEFKRNIFVKMGKIILWISIRELNLIFLAAILLPFSYQYLQLRLFYSVLVTVAVAHNLTWMGIAYYQLKSIIKNK